MTHTHQLIEKVEFLLQLIAGTDAGESETVKDICDLIGKVKADNTMRRVTHYEKVSGLAMKIEGQLVNLFNEHKNPWFVPVDSVASIIEAELERLNQYNESVLDSIIKQNAEIAKENKTLRSTAIFLSKDSVLSITEHKLIEFKNPKNPE